MGVGQGVEAKELMEALTESSVAWKVLLVCPWRKQSRQCLCS
jgi:hypothetical protein